MTSPYALVGEKLIDAGYAAIPIMPGTKRPGSMSFGNWYGRSDWNVYCDRMPSHHEYNIWNRWPDAGVCIAIDHRLKVIDIDTDDAALMTAVLSVLPDSPVKKRGNKGFSAFYRGSNAIVNTPFSIATATKPLRVVDLLAHGRQTVLPPTVHPESLKPYEWVTSDTLVDTPLHQLPLLPDNISDQLAEALTPFGYVPTPDHKALVRGEGDTLWREINDTALANLGAWVPDLKLPDTSRSGKGGYRAVAIWRNVENANLSFHRDGIKDWGSNESHTPLDVVMLAFSVDLYTATDWLCGRIGYQHKQTDDFDVAAFVARSQAKTAPQKTPLVAPEPLPATQPRQDAEMAPVAAPRAEINPFDFCTHGGLMEATARWIFETARAPVAEFATIASIAFLSAFYGRRYVTPTGAGLNLYLIGIAGPGYGKDHPRKAIESLGYDSNLQRLIGPNEVTSDTAIEKVLRRRPCFVMPWDEVGVMLQGVSSKGAASWTRSIRKALLELYSRSTSVWTGKEHADSKTDSSGDPIHCPTVSVLGMSTPTEFYAGITEQNLQDGMVARMTVITADQRPDRHDTPPLLTVPKSLIDQLKADFDAFPSNSKFKAIGDAKVKPILYPARWGEGAQAKWKEYENWQLDLIDENPDKQGIVGRAAEQTVKLATIRAISRDPADPVVELDDILWGYALVQKSLDTIDEGARKYMAGSEFEALHKLLYSAIRECGDDGIAKSVLQRKRGISKVQPRDFETAIKWLIEVGKIKSAIGTGPQGGRPGLRYSAVNETDELLQERKGLQ